MRVLRIKDPELARLRTHVRLCRHDATDGQPPEKILRYFEVISEHPKPERAPAQWPPLRLR
jgi:hypothetical protein